MKRELLRIIWMTLKGQLASYSSLMRTPRATQYWRSCVPQASSTTARLGAFLNPTTPAMSGRGLLYAIASLKS